MDSPEPTPPSTPGPEYGAKLVELSPGQKAGRGRYTLVRLLGKGGMGVVWLAKDDRLGEELALKLLPAQISGDAVALDDMRRETLKSRKLTHPNIIRIHDIFEDDHEPCFISMEFVDGPNLTSLRLKQPERFFQWEEIAPIITQLCDALHYAHSEGVIHRDLKPANFMLDARGRLKLADFGIAAVVSDSMSRISMKHSTSGTLTYMSPQQMAGQPPRPTDDIYALGATIYELLTSKPPFYSGDIQFQVQNVAAIPMEQRLADLGLQNEIPPAVGALVMACLSKEPAQRPQSAAAVAEWIGLNIGTPARSGLSARATGGPSALLAEVTSYGAAVEPAEEAVAEPVPVQSGSKTGLWIALAASVVVLLGVGGAMMRGRGKPTSDAPTAQTPAAVKSSSDTPLASTHTEKSAKTPVQAADSEGLTPIFNGTDLSGWKVPNPNPWWSVSNGILTGRHDPQLRGNVLETVQSYKDVIVEWEARWRGNADSGVFVREGQKIQCQIGLSPSQGRDMTAAIFLQNGGYPAEATNLASLLKPGDWNQFRFEAQGSRYRIWLNGELTVDYTNASFPNAGPIGLQILPNAAGMRIEFRNLRAKPLDTPATASTPKGAVFFGGGGGAGDWILPFASGGYGRWQPDKPQQWRAAAGGTVTGTGPKTHLISAVSFTNFQFKADILSETGANGGMYFHVAGMTPGGFPEGHEAQVYNSTGPDDKTGSLYKQKRAPAGLARDNAWFTQHIIVIGNRITILVDGKVAVSHVDTEGRYTSGKLALQSMTAGKSVSYRNVMVKPLPADPAAALAEAKKDVPNLP